MQERGRKSKYPKRIKAVAINNIRIKFLSLDFNNY